MGQVIVLGSLNRDLVLHVDRLPGPGETLTATGSAEQSGGKGANQAIAAARAGAAVRMIGALGADSSAAVVLDPLRREGIDVTAVRSVPELPTGLAVVSVAADGENSIVVLPGANGDVDAREVAAARPRRGDVLLCQLEVPLTAVAAAAAQARAAGALVVLNTAPADSAATAVLGDVDVLVANQHEARLLAGREDSLEAARLLAAEHNLVCVVTLGADGAVAFRPDGEILSRQAVSVSAIDTTGAGDTFVGYLATGLCEGRDLAEVLADAVAAGTIAVTRRGALDAVPRRGELGGNHVDHHGTNTPATDSKDSHAHRTQQ
ncbi:ribokinase [Aeromicrobium sp. CF4.19]|uniref:ribokinase n=1 Tax=Aeromicrobium sp. CF4.19 TaxID=3373082 RepID=UPI003EE61809